MSPRCSWVQLLSQKSLLFKYIMCLPRILNTYALYQNSIEEEIKCRLTAGNSSYYSVQTLLSSRILSKNLKIKIYKTIILPVVLYGCILPYPN